MRPHLKRAQEVHARLDTLAFGRGVYRVEQRAGDHRAIGQRPDLGDVFGTRDAEADRQRQIAVAAHAGDERRQMFWQAVARAAISNGSASSGGRSGTIRPTMPAWAACSQNVSTPLLKIGL